MARGDVVIQAAGAGYGRKPRPAIIIQADEFLGGSSVTICLITSVFKDLPLIRPQIEPSSENGLKEPSWAMADKIVTIRRDRVGRQIGRLTADEMARLDQAIRIFLGLGM
ncbi:MAG TPA: type II toxin-antitoxin system PemK/MazF family toxin [Stellaceae bacterium]|nr:type II toxin-antitoxin system PemK/MazF family toxin [Stellaceae bacterium]